MDVLRITRFRVAPDMVDDFVARRSTMVSAVYEKCSGLLDTMLTRVDAGVWIDLWWWESTGALEKATVTARQIPEVAAAFALVSDVTAETAEIVSPL